MENKKKNSVTLTISSQQLQQILNLVPDLIVIKGEKSKLLWANKVYQDFHGLTNSELQALIDAPEIELDLSQEFVRDDLTVFKTKKNLHKSHHSAVRHDGADRIFDTDKSVGKGTGLGLSISRKIAQSHDGDLYLYNGSENAKFVLKIPKVTPQI